MTSNDVNMGEIMIAEVDSRGRVQLSRPLREVLDIHPGDKVRLNVEKVIPIETRTPAKNESKGFPLKAPYALAVPA